MRDFDTPAEFAQRMKNHDADVRSLVGRLVSIEERMDEQNRLKSLVFAEARVANIDIAALKAVVRINRSLSYSNSTDLEGLTGEVKRYLDLINTKPGA
ncbi:hypothetical protein KYK29_10265 [Shinella daejeonensis]|uniref:hypothetical protein n=1 Tax=Shinella daejeonensis TaxID=659017 RepID=UPI0020C757F7|nr:hypothetical protein [Shinella daejeonensis]MCP8895319.1 hypothetical protein [Shinella daejeonensis]